MSSRLKSLSLAALLLLSVTCPLRARANPVEVSGIVVGETSPQEASFQVNQQLRQAIEHLNAGQPDMALPLLESALMLSRKNGERVSEATSLVLLTRACIELGKDQQAVQFGESALGMARAVGYTNLEFLARLFLSRAYFSLEEYAKTIEFGEPALDFTQQLNERRDIEENLLFLLSIAYYQRNDYQKAIAAGRQFLDISSELRNLNAEKEVSFFLILSYYESGDLLTALNLGISNLENAKKRQDTEYQIYLLFILYNIYVDRHELQNANAAITEASTLSQTINTPLARWQSLMLLSNFFWEIGKPEKGIKAASSALSLAKNEHLEDAEADSLMHLAAHYFSLKDYTQSIIMARQGLEIVSEKDGGQTKSALLLLLGASYNQLKEPENALLYARQSLVIADQLAIPRARIYWKTRILNLLGSLYAQVGNRYKALKTYQNSLIIESNNAAAYAGIGRIYRASNSPNVSIAYYKTAIAKIETVRQNILGLPQDIQNSFLQAVIGLEGYRNADVYRELADLLLSQGRILEAQQVLEKLKVQELRDFTRDVRAGGVQSNIELSQVEEEIIKQHGTLIAFGETVAECERSSCDQLNELLDRQTLLTQQFNQKIAQLETEARARRSQDTAFFDPKDLVRKAQQIVEAEPGTVLIYPFVLEDKIWLLWAAKGGVVKTVEVPVTQKELAAAVLEFRQRLAQYYSGTKDLKIASKKLYDWLIKPLESELKANQVKNLVFSLDRATRYIPMSALYDGQKYLIENYTVSTILSADLTDTRDRLPPGNNNISVLAMGLSKSVSGFNSLPNVPDELDGIVKTDDNDSKGVYAGSEYLNEAFDFRTLRNNLRGHQILHIATHGNFQPGRPEDSYLLLGTGDKLAIPEIATLPALNDLHLVTLSACETALGGEGSDGVEINSLSYYFLNQGAKAVLASLWLVNDASTAQLMQDFYQNLSQEMPITKAEALRQAQLKMLYSKASLNFSHPYYWSAFILIGNGF